MQALPPCGRTTLSRRLLLLATLPLLAGLGCTRPTVRQEPFTIVMLPDTQNYSQHRPPYFFAQTEWIKCNCEKENIVFVTHVGDLVQHRSSKPAEWKVADGAMAVLDGVVPYGVAIGNHDYDSEEGVQKSIATAFLKCFSPQRCQGREWYGGASPNGLNSYQLFSAGGIDFIILHMEFHPPDETLAWAQSVLEGHPNRAAIVSTHSYLRAKDGMIRETKSAKGRNAGEQMWDKLIRRNPQIFMVLCGHISAEFHQVSPNDAGGRVLEMLADYQNRENGGDGWLRLIRIDPMQKEIRVRTYSPILDRFETGPSSEFTAPLDLPVSPGRAGTASSAAGPSEKRSQ